MALELPFAATVPRLLAAVSIVVFGAIDPVEPGVIVEVDRAQISVGGG